MGRQGRAPGPRAPSRVERGLQGGRPPEPGAGRDREARLNLLQDPGSRSGAGGVTHYPVPDPGPRARPPAGAVRGVRAGIKFLPGRRLTCQGGPCTPVIQRKAFVPLLLLMSQRWHFENTDPGSSKPGFLTRRETKAVRLPC